MDESVIGAVGALVAVLMMLGGFVTNGPIAVVLGFGGAVLMGLILLYAFFPCATRRLSVPYCRAVGTAVLSAMRRPSGHPCTSGRPTPRS
jgi:hypothetical protein